VVILRVVIAEIEELAGPVGIIGDMLLGHELAGPQEHLKIR